MRKLLFTTTLIAGVAAAMTATVPAAAADKEVRVYNWSDYIDEEILKEFTEETGIKVIYDVFDSNETLETKLLAGGTGYDVVVPSGTFLSRQIQAGVFQKLDKSKLPNLKNMWPKIQKLTAGYDPDNAYSINYMWGTTGIGINVDKVKERLGADMPLNSWDLVFKPELAEKLQDCGIHWLDAPEEIFPTALNYLGFRGDSHDTDEIAKAAEMLDKVRGTVQKFHSSEYINALANGDICVAIGWSGDVLQARDRASEADKGVTVEYIIPKEGAQMWFDQMAIPADATNVDEAHAFLNYIMEPKVMAKASNYVYYANGNLASQEFLNEDVIKDPAIYPDAETSEKLYTTTAYPPKVLRVVTRAWTKVKTGQ
ncbi:putrescine transport system substrate-binding protein [Rhodobium orientis]|uniref:Putrescine-binding periplasmic protein n=1 Tax=Rhodobium orientis TaxID=34017 RepID=A0A327JM05_9HYPH|nr:putrescine transport system substrate-binding protein [Rhodobium orientis]MBK5948817.1 spermidine/putrescine ABC transporter substrate-binding protein PotF [Rhodobium orientis]RAI26424.1 spermidine/putrescine ABC transporter substrate-binding protein PotF [Rhodobium orientis]